MLWTLPSAAQTVQPPAPHAGSCSNQLEPCKMVLRKGQQAPIDCVFLTSALAAELAAKLDQCLSQVDLEKAHGLDLVKIEQDACAQRTVVAAQTAASREALLKEALQTSQKQTQDAAGETAKAEMGQWLWGAGGAVVGVLVGAVVTGGAVFYFTTVAPAR